MTKTAIPLHATLARLVATILLALATASIMLQSSRPDCPTEDSPSCYWNGQDFGNDAGDSFIAGP